MRDLVSHYLVRLGELVGLPVPNVLQSKGLCGPACLRAVLLYYGIDKSLEELAVLTGADPEDGTPSDGLVAAAVGLGFQAFRQSDASLGDLYSWASRGVPVIVDWFSTDKGHYSVVKALQGGNVLLMDPELGAERAMPSDAFERVWFNFEQPPVEAHRGLQHHQLIVVRPPA